MLKAVLLEESVFDEPTEDEVMLYAESLGIDVEKEQDLLYIAKEGISAHLPTGWQVLKVTIFSRSTATSSLLLDSISYLYCSCSSFFSLYPICMPWKV